MLWVNYKKKLDKAVNAGNTFLLQFNS